MSIKKREFLRVSSLSQKELAKKFKLQGCERGAPESAKLIVPLGSIFNTHDLKKGSNDELDFLSI